MKTSPLTLLHLLFFFIVITIGVVIWNQNSCHVQNQDLSVVQLEQAQYHQSLQRSASAPGLAWTPPVQRGIRLEPSPLNEPSIQELHAFPGAIVVEAAEIEGPEPGQKTRLRILKTHFKYPNIRTEEIIDTHNHSVVLRQEMIADHFLVTLSPGEDPQTFFNGLGNQVTSMERVTDNAPLYRVELSSSSLEALPQAMTTSARATAGISEPDGIIHAASMPKIPNDARFDQQWGLFKLCPFVNLLNKRIKGISSGIDACDAWNVRTDASSVIVAVIDTGILDTHEDLVDNMWTNPEPIIDYVGWNPMGHTPEPKTDTHGWNAYAKSGDPMDDGAHGTMCAGIIGATGNNSMGICGVAWKVQLMACKFLNSKGQGTVSDEIVCIDYAINHGAKILNCSYGAPFTDRATYDAFQRVRAAGVIAVCGAGNDGVENTRDSISMYPASYSFDNIVAVAATDYDDTLAEFSNFGKTTVHLAAPGVQILSTWGPSDQPFGYSIIGFGNSAYSWMDGTSAAAPFVTGTLALMTAQFPKKSYTELITRLLDTTDKLPSLQGKTISGGRLNAAKALGYDPTP